MGTVDYSGRLPHVDPSTVPYTFHIVMGHILDSHAFDEGKKYGKSMFCWDLSDEESLRKLIIFAFVDEFGDPNSSGPSIVDVGTVYSEYSVLRYKYPYGLGWSGNGRAARCLYLRYLYDGRKVYICQVWPT